MKHLSFILSCIGLIILAGLACKGVDTSASIVSLCAVYITSRAAKKASFVHSASKDNQADTQKAIESLRE